MRNALGVSFSGCWNRRKLNAEPEGKFRNNSIANEYTHYGCEVKTNRKKGHSNYRHKGAYGVAMNWKPQDQRQMDAFQEEPLPEEDEFTQEEEEEQDGQQL